MSEDIASPVDIDETRLLYHGESPIYGAVEDVPSVRCTSSSSDISGSLEPKSESETSSPERAKPMFRDMFTRALWSTLLNHALLAFVEMAHSTLLPLMYSTSIHLGGLGLEPFTIGLVLGAFGCVNAIGQAKFLGRLIRVYGARKVYIISFACIIMCFLMYPVMSFFAKRAGRVDGIVYTCMAIQLCFQAGIYSAYGEPIVSLARVSLRHAY